MRREKLRVFARKRFPIIGHLTDYNSEKFLSDLSAGITVGLTVMPQALAYAALAGVEPQFGLYSAFAGCFVYIFFGSCKEITIGPTALMGQMTYQQVMNRNSDYAVLLCFLSGVVQFLMAVLNLGVLVDFISIPVTVGFTSATSLIIISSQIKYILGIKFSSSGFFDTLQKTYENIGKIRWTDFTLAFICIVLLLVLRKLKDCKWKNWTRFFWVISTSRNALVVLCTSFIAYYCEIYNFGEPFILTGKVKPGLPSFKPPPFETQLENRTVGFQEMLADLGSSIFMVPVIAVLGNVAIAKAFANGATVDATQELFALSFCNAAGSFFSSIPITGSFSRSAVNHASGVKTPIGGLYTGILVLLSLSFLTPYFRYIPKAALGAVIISAVVFMIEYEVIRPMWKSNRKDLIPMATTFILCLMEGVEAGIVLGVAINIMQLLYKNARPSIIISKLTTPSGLEYILVTPGNSLYFPAAEFIKSHVASAGLSSSHLPVVVDCRFILGADFTAAKGISSVMRDFSKRKQSLYFLNPSEEVLGVFKGADLDLKCLKRIEDLEEEISESTKLLKLLPLLSDGDLHNDLNDLNDLNDVTSDGFSRCYQRKESSQ